MNNLSCQSGLCEGRSNLGRSSLFYPMIRIQEHPNSFIWEHEIYEKMKDRMMMQTGTFIQFDGEYEKVNYLTLDDLFLVLSHLIPFITFSDWIEFSRFE